MKCRCIQFNSFRLERVKICADAMQNTAYQLQKPRKRRLPENNLGFKAFQHIDRIHAYFGNRIAALEHKHGR